MILKSKLDIDSVIEEIESNKSPYHSLIMDLLNEPTTAILEKMLTSYSLNDLIATLKHIIKHKFSCLTKDYQSSIIKILEILVGYNHSIDTLLINILRHRTVQLLLNIFTNPSLPRNSYWFYVFHLQSYNILVNEKIFLAEHGNIAKKTKTDQKGRLNPPTMYVNKFCEEEVLSRDFLSRKIRFLINYVQSNHYDKETMTSSKREFFNIENFIFAKFFNNNELKSLTLLTPIHFISSTLSSDLELNLLFIINVTKNYGFYENLLFTNFITDEDIGFNCVRYLVSIPQGNNSLKLIDKIVGTYPESLVAVVYDALFHTPKAILNAQVIKFIESNLENPFLKMLTYYFPFIEAYLDSNTANIEIIEKLFMRMDYTTYYDTIIEMKTNKMPVIDHEIYPILIRRSFCWDNYMQVFLWKVLMHQKIVFGFEVDDSLVKEGTKESIDGQFMISKIR